LNGSIETCKDGQKGFAIASEKATGDSLKTLFAKRAAQRAGFVVHLSSQHRHKLSPTQN
jgi:hypothetical protein